MKKNRKSRIARTVATGGTVTLATLGLTTCDDGGVEDPLPPPPLVCKDGNHGQNLSAHGSIDSLSLRVTLIDWEHSASFDTVS
ncbi:MAG TPA: hypothetical protein VF247_04500, partial [Candidatus Krumholzibacteria bacterium]